MASRPSAYRPSPLLPWEVIERIINHSSHRKTIFNFSLTCRDLRPRSLCLLVADVKFHNRDKLFDFCDFLKANPHLKPIVRSILVNPNYFAPVPLIRMLPNLSEVQFIGTEGMDYKRDYDSFERAVLNQTTLNTCRFLTTRIHTLSLSDFSFATSIQLLQVLSAFTSIAHLICSNVFLDAESDLELFDTAKRRLAPRLQLITLAITGRDRRNSLSYRSHYVPEGISAGELLLRSGLVQSTVERLTVLEGVYTLIGLPQQFNWTRLWSLTLELRYQDIGDGIIFLKDFRHLAVGEVTIKIHERTAIPIFQDPLFQEADLPELERTLLRFPQVQLVWVRAVFPVGMNSFWVQDVENCFPMLSRQGAITVVSDPALRTVRTDYSISNTINHLVISSDSKWAASASMNQIALWHIAGGVMVQQRIVYRDGHVIKWLAFSLDSRRLACNAGSDGEMAVWDLGGGPPRGLDLNTVHHRVTCCAWSPRNDVIASGSRNGDLRLWDANTLQPVAVVTGAAEGYKIDLVEFSPDGSWLLIGYWNTAGNNYHIWDLKTGEGRWLRMSVVERTPEIYIPVIATFNSSSTRFALVSKGGVVEILGTWGGGRGHVALGCRVRRRYMNPAWHLEFSPDGNQVLTLPEDGDGPPTYAVKIWDAWTGAELLLLKGHEYDVFSACFSPCGKYVASASKDHTVRLWRTSDGSCCSTLSEHNRPVTQVAFSPDGKTLVSGDDCGRVIIRRMCHVLPVEERDP